MRTNNLSPSVNSSNDSGNLAPFFLGVGVALALGAFAGVSALVLRFLVGVSFSLLSALATRFLEDEATAAGAVAGVVPGVAGVAAMSPPDPASSSSAAALT